MATTTVQHDFAISISATVPDLSISDPKLRAVAEGYGMLRASRDTVLLPGISRIASDRGKNALGKMEEWTAIAESELVKYNGAAKEIEAVGIALAAELAQEEAKAQPLRTDSAVERLDQYETARWFREQSPATRQELTNAFVRGEQVELLDRLLALPEYMSPFAPPIRTMLYRERIGSRVDRVAVERIQKQAETVSTVSGILKAHIKAVAAGADRSRLVEKGLLAKGRSDYKADREKSDWIDAHGRDAWMRLDS